MPWYFHLAAQAIRAMVGLGRTVLLTAFTNSAVDNICLKLASAAPDVPFMRLPGANLSAVHAGVRAYVPGGAMYPNAAASCAAVQHLVRTVPVVASTCLGLRHAMMAKRTFDVCVLDEASQVRCGLGRARGRGEAKCRDARRGTGGRGWRVRVCVLDEASQVRVGEGGVEGQRMGTRGIASVAAPSPWVPCRAGEALATETQRRLRRRARLVASPSPLCSACYPRIRGPQSPPD